MALSKEAKQEATKRFGKSEADTGSPEVQIAMLTERINGLTEHLRTTCEGSLLAARPAGARRPAAPVPELPAAERISRATAPSSRSSASAASS